MNNTIYINKLKRFQRPTKFRLQELIREIIKEEGQAVKEIGVTFVDGDEIRRLNRDFLDKDRPTDVIAFNLSLDNQPLIGDIYISVDQARLQAAEYTVSLENEIVRLVAHGMLHLLGYDHRNSEGAQKMKQGEERWIKRYKNKVSSAT
ncbi:MAG: rRNA maturation RNase YbeY [Candidatus Cloacimonetes bacterium 4572_55]|nr:MAG: rRNA maturation RNase YbeY [Candidatus Cloacimonetes bacterium 4572_55]